MSYSDPRRPSTRGRFGKAESLFLRALKIQEQRVGAERLDTAYTLDGLATLYLVQGKYAEAEPLFLRSLHIMEQAWGSEDSKLAEYLNGIAILYILQGKNAEAEPFSLRYDRIREQKIRDGSIRPLATGELEQDVWQSALLSLRNRPD
jgi:tetratricopeptide (TPR) repeat protein